MVLTKLVKVLNGNINKMNKKNNLKGSQLSKKIRIIGISGKIGSG